VTVEIEAEDTRAKSLFFVSFTFRGGSDNDYYYLQPGVDRSSRGSKAYLSLNFGSPPSSRVYLF